MLLCYPVNMAQIMQVKQVAGFNATRLSPEEVAAQVNEVRRLLFFLEDHIPMGSNPCLTMAISNAWTILLAGTVEGDEKQAHNAKVMEAVAEAAFNLKTH